MNNTDLLSILRSFSNIHPIRKEEFKAFVDEAERRGDKLNSIEMNYVNELKALYLINQKE
jgi:hypothetical protein